MSATSFQPAPAVEAIASELIPKYHPHLQGLAIRYVFRDKASTSAGKINLGKARLLSGISAYLGVIDETERQDLLEAQGKEAFFVIEIAANMWKDLDERARIALVDHELCHCYAWEEEDKEDGIVRRLKIVPHDLEEFACVVDRHGMWMRDVEILVNAAAKHLQPELALDQSRAPTQPLSQTAMREKREGSVKESPANKAGRKPKDKGLTVVAGRLESGEQRVKIGGVDYKGSVVEARGKAQLFVEALDDEGKTLKHIVDGTKFDTKDNAWAHFDEWVEQECGKGDAA